LAPPDPRGHAQKEQMPVQDSVMGMVADKIKGVMSGSGGNGQS
jgi:Mn-containing catalase